MQLKQLDIDSEPEGKKDEGNDVANGEHSGIKAWDDLTNLWKQ